MLLSCEPQARLAVWNNAASCQSGSHPVRLRPIDLTAGLSCIATPLLYSAPTSVTTRRNITTTCIMAPCRHHATLAMSHCAGHCSANCGTVSTAGGATLRETTLQGARWHVPVGQASQERPHWGRGTTAPPLHAEHLHLPTCARASHRCAACAHACCAGVFSALYDRQAA
jgi:hypothetical protein